MNKKTILAICGGVVAVVAVVAIVIAVVNNNSGNNNGNNNGGSNTGNVVSPDSNSDGSGLLWSENGIDIKEATIEYLGDGYFNIITVFANNNSEAVEFDNSKFRFELADGYVIKMPSSTKTLEANRPRIQFAQSLSKEENSHLNLGDTITVYYGDTLLQTTTIEEF